MGKQHEWISLLDTLVWMQTEFRFSIFDHQEALKNALLSCEVPARGKARHEYHGIPSHEYQRIERYITADITADDLELLTSLNTMRLKFAAGAPAFPGSFLVGSRIKSFEAVQIDRPSLEAWINSNILEHPTLKAAAKPDADYVHRATDFVKGRLEANRNMSREDARQVCAEKFPDLTGRDFERRVWKEAREALGLGRAMSPGRPKS